MRTLVHPQIAARLTPTHFPSRCTIEENTGGTDAVGQPIETWTAVAGLENIPCLIGGRFSTKLGRSTNRTVFDTEPMAILNGVFSSITQAMRAVIDGRAFAIIGILVSSVSPFTELQLEERKT